MEKKELLGKMALAWLRDKVTFLELEVNSVTSVYALRNLLPDFLVMRKKSSNNFTSMHLSIHSSSLFPSPSNIPSLSISLDALGSVSPGEICHPLSDIPVGSGQPTSAPFVALFPKGSGLILAKAALPLEDLSTVIGWLIQLDGSGSGKPESSLPILSAIARFTVELILINTATSQSFHFQLQCCIWFLFPLKLNKSNHIFTQHIYSAARFGLSSRTSLCDFSLLCFVLFFSPGYRSSQVSSFLWYLAQTGQRINLKLLLLLWFSNLFKFNQTDASLLIKFKALWVPSQALQKTPDVALQGEWIYMQLALWCLPVLHFQRLRADRRCHAGTLQCRN